MYHVYESISSGLDSTDIDDMGAFDAAANTINVNNNYVYDAQGRLVKDRQEEIDTIIWTKTNKVKEIRRTLTSEKKNLLFDYDAMGHRVAKHVYNNQTLALEKSTYYLLDAQGNPMSMYEHELKPNVPKNMVFYRLAERNIYGTKRLGTVSDTVNMVLPNLLPSYGVLGNRSYEFSNHLGNVLMVSSDIVYPISSGGSSIDGYEVGINQATDYSPFGVQLDGRTISNTLVDNHRYGFQGQEKDDEIKGEGNSLNYEYRMHDPRLGRFFVIDPLASKYPYYSPYQFSGNRLIDCIELEGLEPKGVGKTGEIQAAQGGDGKWHSYKMSEGGSWEDKGTNISGHDGMDINIPKNASNIYLKVIPETKYTIVRSLGAVTLESTTVTIPSSYEVTSFNIGNEKYSANYKENGSFHGYWNSSGGKFSNKLNSDGTYKGDSYETFMQRSIDWNTLKKLKLNSSGWKAYAIEAGLNVAQDLLMDKLIKKGGGQNNPQGTIDFGSSWDNYIDKYIKYGLMVHGPGTIYLAPNCDPNYPDYTHVQYWFKGYYGSERSPIFDIKPVKTIYANE